MRGNVGFCASELVAPLLIFYAFDTVPLLKRNPVLADLALLLADMHGIDRMNFPNRYSLRAGPLVVVAGSMTAVVEQGTAEPYQAVLDGIELVKSP